MGSVGPASARATSDHRLTGQGPSDDGGGDAVAVADRRPVARSAGTVWTVAERVYPVAAVASGRGLGPGAGRAPDRGRRPGRPGLDAAFPRRHRDPRPPERGRGPKRGGDHALGCSKGGFSTKIYLRAERGGKPVCWVLRPGKRQEATQVEALMERGALRPRRLPRAQRGGAGDQPAQAVPGDRHPLRETGGDLPGVARPRRHSALAARLKTRPSAAA